MPHNANSSDSGNKSAGEPEHFFQQVNIEFLVHELKDPLSVIEAGATMLLKKPDPDHPLASRQQRTLERILRNSHKARRMLWELLEVGRAEAACFECHTFQPETVVREVLLEVVESDDPKLYEAVKTAPDTAAKYELLGPQGIRLDIMPAPGELEQISHDETKFRHVVINLLKNAIYYRRRQLIVHVAGQHDSISVTVRDDGPGIAPEHHETIFERYKQVTSQAGVARNGHGLGLAMARSLARSMGGDITVQSELGQGAVFRLRLPMKHPE